MPTLFRFRKYLTAAEASGVGVSAYPAAFSSSLSAYNTATGSGPLLTSWKNAILISSGSTKIKLKDYFKRSWIEEDGDDVYIGSATKRAASSNEIQFLIYSSDETAVKSYHEMVDAIAGYGVCELYDNHSKLLRRLVLTGSEIIYQKSNRHSQADTLQANI